MDDSDSRESIKYRLLGSGDVLRSWGPGYIMHLKSELRSEVPRLEVLVAVAHSGSRGGLRLECSVTLPS
ncbi:hypothetical protein Tsubulata_043178 [Turnera subulata]|uniref:RPN1 N-terminal domain-containing protein n=1 Tax=Turnera subulata TaxID=218843 RepID=A0A9Q0J4R4_9ROSI|nr:hypothetical protein Tsubulata_043178 [Turnera subulata]